MSHFLSSFGVFMTHFAVQKSFVAVIFTYGLLLGIGIGIAYAVPMACAMKASKSLSYGSRIVQFLKHYLVSL